MSDVTASVLIGPLATTSRHGTPYDAPAAERLFAPSHVLTLMEGHRATWIVQRCPSWDRPSPTRFIQPHSPAFLLASAIIGYTAMVRPRLVDEVAWLREAIEPGSCRRVTIGPIDEALAERVFASCGKHVYGIVTALPLSTLQHEELRLAASHGMPVATFAAAVTL